MSDANKVELTRGVSQGKTTGQLPSNKKSPQRDPEQNHGRYGAKDYPGCEKIEIKHSEFQTGSFCPECAADDTQARLYKTKPGTLICLKGQPFISGTHYSIEKWRCAVCHKVYAATVPEAIEQQPKYDAGCTSNLAIARYYLGLPFKRIELFQRMEGVPIPDATQWEKVSKLAETVRPVPQVLEKLAAEGRGIFYDDTPNRIISCMKQEISARKGVTSTALVSEMGQYCIYLFYTSQRYAAENIKPLLESRQSQDPFFTMSDASSNNIPKGLDEELLARWIISFCLVHGRRKFYEIYDFFDQECDFVLRTIGRIYENESVCKKQKLTAEERLIYHQTHSAPLMQALHHWLNNKLLYGEVELNSGLGESMIYMLKHWETLTRFLHVAGVPIDNSICEQAIKVVLRHRKNSLFYKTLYGAEVGDILMSLIHTAARHGTNAFLYLNALQYHAREVALAPEDWLPWTYQATQQKMMAPPLVPKVA